jgi:hypothetical protein
MSAEQKGTDPTWSVPYFFGGIMFGKGLDKQFFLLPYVKLDENLITWFTRLKNQLLCRRTLKA